LCFTYVFDRFTAATGISRDEVIGHSVDGFLPWRPTRKRWNAIATIYAIIGPSGIVSLLSAPRVARKATCEIASKPDPTGKECISLIMRVNSFPGWGHISREIWPRRILIFSRDINALGDFRGGAKVPREFTAWRSMISIKRSAACALAQRIGHRGRDFDFAWLGRRADPQDIALFGKLHGHSHSGRQLPIGASA